MHLPMPTTLSNIKEQDSIAPIVFSVEFALVKLFLLLEVVLWRMYIVTVDEPRKVCAVGFFDFGFCICGIGIRIAGLILTFKAALVIAIIVGREVHDGLTSSHVDLTGGFGSG